MNDPFSPERKTVWLKKQNLFGSGYAGLGYVQPECRNRDSRSVSAIEQQLPWPIGLEMLCTRRDFIVPAFLPLSFWQERTDVHRGEGSCRPGHAGIAGLDVAHGGSHPAQP